MRKKKRLLTLCIMGVLILTAAYVRITPALWKRVEKIIQVQTGTLVGNLLGRTVQSIVNGDGSLHITIQGMQMDSTGPVSTGITGAEAAIDRATHPYYCMLDSTQQTLYKQVYAAALAAAGSFAPEVKIDNEQLHEVVEAVYYDCPGLFWLDTGYSFACTQEGICTAVTLQYLFDGDELKTARANFERAASAIVEGARQYNSLLERERYVHNVIVAYAEYDEEASMNQSAYSALILGKTVCAGYARAFQYIMNRLGMTTYYCVGYSGGDHAWNLVQLEDGWYNVDLTWDDVTGAEYGYFNGTDADFAATHTRTGTSACLPACTATQFRVFNAQYGVSGFWDSFGGVPAPFGGQAVSGRSERPREYGI